MKIRILFLAALGASCAANAQSSVTIFGIVDAAVSYGQGSVSNTTSLTNSQMLASRLGFRGTEDLGDGMSAGFWLEAGLSNDTGAGQATNINNQASGGAIAGINGGQGLTFNRRSVVTLTSRQWGEVRLGRDYTPVFQVQASVDPFYVTGLGATESILGAFAANAPYSRSGGVGSVVARASNSIAYELPKFDSGFYAYGQLYFGENPSGSATSSDGSGKSVRVGWAKGAFDVSVGYGKTSFSTGDITTTAFGAKYDLGTVKLSAIYAEDDVAGALPDGKGWMIGASAPFGPHAVQATYSTYKLNDATESGANKLALSYTYSLSKRTAAYIVASQLSNHGASAQSLLGAATAAGTTSTGTSIGLRHSF